MTFLFTELPYTKADDTSDSDDAILELGIVEQTIDLGDLQPMETVVKKPRKKKKKKGAEKPANAEETKGKPVKEEAAPDPYAGM